MAPKALKSVAASFASNGSSHKSFGSSVSWREAERLLLFASGGGSATPLAHLPTAPVPEDTRRPWSGGTGSSRRPAVLFGASIEVVLVGRSRAAWAQISSPSKLSQQTGSSGSLAMIGTPSRCFSFSGMDVVVSGRGLSAKSFSRVNRITFLSFSDSLLLLNLENLMLTPEPPPPVVAPRVAPGPAPLTPSLIRREKFIRLVDSGTLAAKSAKDLPLVPPLGGLCCPKDLDRKAVRDFNGVSSFVISLSSSRTENLFPLGFESLPPELCEPDRLRLSGTAGGG
mmetsp:Transcript_4301/g.6380  ORF Transcript_4301/g.6380 Transcript_4301/m.6380 type:complete len:283 (-) Transcript_4301:198-1046(-)